MNKIGWFGVIWLWCVSAQAALVTNLYDARVPIAQQSSRAQQQAAKDAFGQVLVKIRGNRDILDSELVRSKMEQAQDFIRQYRFDSQSGQYYFIASFDPSKVDELVRSAGYPVWGSRRPSTLLWLASQEGGKDQRSILSEQSTESMRTTVMDTARLRGIPLNLPLMDLDDLSQVGVYDIWGRFIDRLATAGNRYQVEAVLSARLYPIERQTDLPGSLEQEVAAAANTQWQLDWNFALGQEREQGSLSGEDKQALLAELINQHADRLAARFAVGAEGEGASVAVLQFSNVQDLATYVNISKVLLSLSVVSHVGLDSIEGHSGSFRVRLLGSEQDLLNAISLERHFQRQLDAFGQPVGELQFIWVP
ncbi:DUF2066 domain-containing protein [Bowmanella dokdonensis]|uniref:DUF2066 domain-containing protein n=1 Tax=Bowmanella dokdonensis TaxID=751969 RepID=A0A939IQB3_9ALTE|nr:DUF2066 domain-containing protein [Bowmanella dokdonensis]MBN7824417.1 DUF2066 domain-containing protein [Bowmanella dokdonensis]